jgi:hypothetical protein
MKPGRDVLWVLAGRTDSNLPKLQKILAKRRMRFVVFYLCYDTKQMFQYCHWKRQRGIANSKCLELALYVYKGRAPKKMPKNRMHVDVGSPLFNAVVKNVPMLAPRDQAFVSREVRETSLISMVGVPDNEDIGEQEKLKLLPPEDDDGERLHQPEEADRSAKVLVAAKNTKRELYRKLSGTEVQWFPHDNSIELLKEFCWEAGRPRWVFFGTPAGGAGVHGCLESGCSVVALCYDDHHRNHLEKFVLERAVEAMVTGTTLVFKDDALQAQTVHLNLTTTPNASSAKKPDEKASEGEPGILETPKKLRGPKAEKKPKEKKKTKKRKKKPKKEKKPETDSESSFKDSDSDDDHENIWEDARPAKMSKNK